MKKAILLVTAIAGLSMVSCKKDYECYCVMKDSNGSVMQESTVTIHATESDAKSACSSSASSGGASMSCSIK
jgi:hypothetical protein